MICIAGNFYSTEAVAKSFRCTECGAELDVAQSDGAYTFTCSADKDHKGVKKMELIEIVTLTGMTMSEVLDRLDEQLDEKAYKKIGGSSLGFTDILPAWRDEYFNRIFGLAGFGWWFTYSIDPNNLSQYKDPKNAKMSVAMINRLDMFYRLVVDGVITTCGPVSSSGYHSNAFDAGNALKGAVTSALGKAASKMCWQLSVYKGLRGHDQEHDPESAVKRPAMPMEKSALLINDVKSLSALAVAYEEFSPVSQRLLLGIAHTDREFSNMPDDFGEEVTNATKATLMGLFGKSDARNLEEINALSNSLIGKDISAVNYGEVSSLWDMLARLANGVSSVEAMGRAYMAINNGE